MKGPASCTNCGYYVGKDEDVPRKCPRCGEEDTF